MRENAAFNQILSAVNGKCSYRVRVANNSKATFEEMRKAGRQLLELLKTERNQDSMALLEYHDLGKNQFQMSIGEDAIIFNLHHDIFELEQGHPMQKTSYLKEDPFRAFCGMVSIYNFLSSSLEMNRGDDMGNLVARVFINGENHFFVEGRKKLGFLFSSLDTQTISPESVMDVIVNAAAHCVETDLEAPPFEAFATLNVLQIHAINGTLGIHSSRPLGFHLQNPVNQME